MTWASRVPPRPPRRTTNPYPIRFVAVCGKCPLHMGSYDLHVAEGAIAWHAAAKPEHADAVEVVRADDLQ